MPNSGSTDPPDPLGPIGSDGPQALSQAPSPAEIPATDGTEPVRGAAPADLGPTDTEAIASALGRGALDPQSARAQLIDQAVRAQLPPDAAPETIAAIRAEVEAMMAGDPVLEHLLRP